LQQFGVDSLYGGSINGSYDSSRFKRNSGNFTPGFDNAARVQPSAGVNVAGSTALYHHHGTRYGLSHGNVNPRIGNGPDNKMNGLHGPKHKRGDVDRECTLLC
jgi:hypothetical protein